MHNPTDKAMSPPPPPPPPSSTHTLKESQILSIFWRERSPVKKTANTTFCTYFSSVTSKIGSVLFFFGGGGQNTCVHTWTGCRNTLM